MIQESLLRQLLEPFGLDLTPAQFRQLITYLDLLLRWNRNINLTSVRTPEECVTRHFGESLYLARWVHLQGSLLDIGSGAGFPGLALKIPFPGLAVTLLEPSAKKRAFLKEVVRTCGFTGCEIRGDRLAEFVKQKAVPEFDSITARAVGQLDQLIPLATRRLKAGGRLCLWLTREQRERLSGREWPVRWEPPIPLPLAQQREIWVGTKVAGGFPG